MEAKEIKEDITTIRNSLVDISVTLAKQEVSLTEHIKRTGLLETQVSLIQSKQDKFDGAVTFIKLISIIAGIAVVFQKFI